MKINLPYPLLNPSPDFIGISPFKGEKRGGISPLDKGGGWKPGDLFIQMFISTQFIFKKYCIFFQKKWQNQFTKLVNFFSPKIVNLVEIDMRFMKRNTNSKLKNNYIDNFWLSTQILIKIMSTWCVNKFTEIVNFVVKQSTFLCLFFRLKKTGNFRLNFFEFYFEHWSFVLNPLDFGDNHVSEFLSKSK